MRIKELLAAGQEKDREGKPCKRNRAFLPISPPPSSRLQAPFYAARALLDFGRHRRRRRRRHPVREIICDTSPYVLRVLYSQDYD